MIVTVWDWDDSLFSTTYLFKLGVDTVQFPELSKSIKICLDMALNVGHVYIITNGERGWVQKCITDHLVYCDSILERVHILSTVDTGLSSIHDLKWRKIAAFDRISGMFRSRTPKGEMHHLICFGDCAYDRTASQHIREKIRTNTYVKNVKLVSKPSLKTLLLEQKNIQNVYSTLLMSPQHLDLELFPPSFLPSNLTTQELSDSSDQTSQSSSESKSEWTDDDFEDVVVTEMIGMGVPGLTGWTGTGWTGPTGPTGL